MIPIDVLRSELQGRLRLLSEDLIERGKDATIRAELREAFDKLHDGGRTAQSFEMWLEDFLEQIAVAWLLACVFVRFMEDNELIKESWIAGEGGRRKRAEDALELFFREHNLASEREYFQHVFHEVGKIKAAQDLFAEGKTPLWVMGPSADAARELLNYWREIEPETGLLKRSFQVENADTRFLGDLYQDLSEKAKKKYALLQTPVFVEEFILDRTLTPALDEFGPEKVRLIDPTCGSGHFLLGAFERLRRLWETPAYSTGKAETDVQKALDGVWGVDVNPFAVAIARFRLIVAALHACEIKLLKQAPAWNIHLATGDSLLFGGMPDGDGRREKIDQQGELFETPAVFAVEDKASLQTILGQGYHVVVGNPPYITVKDAAQNQAYRNLYETCRGKYSLGVPFTERFWQLGVQKGEDGATGGGYIGMITANSFMKREFGKKLIEEFFPKVDLTHVLDTSGAYIPGHGTPTVILFGRTRKPVGDTVRAVLGIKGEPATPEDPSQGLVWKSILSHIDRSGGQDEFTSSTDIPRTTFASHPWSIGGGGAADLKERIDLAASETLQTIGCDAGIGVVTGEDDAYGMPTAVARRHGISDRSMMEFVVGDIVRDWRITDVGPVLFPYDIKTLAAKGDKALLQWLWPYRTVLMNRIWFRQTHARRGLEWFEYAFLSPDKIREPLSITFAEVASHNHFVLDRGGRIFKQTAPVIKLPAESTEDAYRALLGLLNSSTICFWMKQVCHQKQMMGGDGIRISSRAQVPYQFSGTRMRDAPVPEAFNQGPLRDRLLRLAARMDVLSQELATLTATESVSQGLSGGASRIAALFRQFQERRAQIRSEMVFLQEEIDFTVYAMFGLADESLFCDPWDWPEVRMDAGMRPFEILQNRNLDGFPVVPDVPDDWPKPLQAIWRRRMETIRNSKELTLIEDDHYKRRWLGRQGLFNHAARQDELKNACKNWLLDRLESAKYRRGTDKDPELTTTSQMADVAASDKKFRQVAEVYTGRPDFNTATLVAELVESESVPLLPNLRYKATGLRKRAVWENVWELQRRQDAGETVGAIPVPPKYAGTDFQKTDYWRLRGKLDVPKERWISFPHCSPDGDPSLVVAWAGWNHLQQTQAVATYYGDRHGEGWSPQRLTPLLTALDLLLPWIFQWHSEIDPESGILPGECRIALEGYAQELDLSLETIRRWTPPSPGRGARRTNP